MIDPKPSGDHGEGIPGKYLLRNQIVARVKWRVKPLRPRRTGGASRDRGTGLHVEAPGRAPGRRRSVRRGDHRPALLALHEGEEGRRGDELPEALPSRLP